LGGFSSGYVEQNDTIFILWSLLIARFCFGDFNARGTESKLFLKSLPRRGLPHFIVPIKENSSMIKSIIQKIISQLIRNNPLLINRNKINTSTYLNVGSGPNLIDGFINVDYFWRPGLDMCWDIRKRIPIQNHSLDGIYSEHCLEHVTFTDGLNVLKDFYRLLKRDGVLRIVVPDAELYLNLYHQSQQGLDVEFPYIGEEGQKDKKADSIAGLTPMIAINRVFRGYGHMFAYDFETLKNALTYAGFQDIQRASFQEGIQKELLVDSEYRRPQSLYIEATKKEGG